MAAKINVLISEQEVNARIAEMGKQISEEYAGKEVHLICILKGSVFFTCELAKRITVPVTLDFMSVSSYGDGTKSSGIVKIVKDLDETLEGKEVIVIEDIIDTTENCKIASCGDGINDLPSLARADVGIAMGAIGSDATVEKSDVVIMDDDVIKIPLAIKIAKRTRRVVLENIIFSIGVKAALLVLSIIGILPLYIAVIGDVGLLLLAVLNSLRAGR